jgi:hypothetical protein
MLDPANRWRPVTEVYQEELAPRSRRSLRDRIFRRPAGKTGPPPAQARPAAGVLGVTWFYLLNAGAYFASGSILLSLPLSDLAFQLMRHAHLIVPFPIGRLEDVPMANVLAESLFIMAVVSGAVAVLWMTHARSARWITLLYAAGWLVRNVLYFFPGRFGPRLPRLSPGAHRLLLLDTFAEALIFLYLLFYMRVEREKQRRKT